MDKSWIIKPRNSIEYEEGVRRFIDFAFQHSSIEGKILCPCSPCGFIKWLSKETVYDHLLCKKFPEGYTFWFYHGESKFGSSSNVAGGFMSHGVRDHNVDVDPMFNMINDAFGINRQCDNEAQFHSKENIAQDEGTNCFANEEVNADKEFHELVKDGEQPLYGGCQKYSKLSFIVKLYHIKCLCGMTDKSMNMILELLCDAFEHAKIPSSFYEAKKTITNLFKA
ncbi:hypothetical protein QN277_005569 [Acacia crassicarpa]|uniref:Transposase-associated domain-containing protein n=1 Tax=Acacia crassicarpa TaxID=499986 RepID=A0AAE1IWP7_9FABA|nr:hypothetical protein QN277_005569 [Acacia crassicarpa]